MLFLATGIDNIPIGSYTKHAYSQQNDCLDHVTETGNSAFTDISAPLVCAKGVSDCELLGEKQMEGLL